MRTSDEIKARLHHGSHELAQAQQLLATGLDHIQTAYDEIQVCNDRADLIDSANSALNHRIHALTEEMDRVFALRNDESDIYLRQENSKLKRESSVLQQAVTRQREEQQARLAGSVKAYEELLQRNGNLERFNQLLISRINEMKENYENAIIENTELKDTKKALQNTPGKYHRGRKLSLYSADYLKLSMSWPTPPLQTLSRTALRQDRSPLAGR